MDAGRFGHMAQEGEHKMADTINVRDLLEEDVELLERWVERLRAKARRERQRSDEPEKHEEPAFAVWPLGVKGKLTREKIYDYL
jgi:hypothetical protein